jgi:hypothetical protein
VARVPGTLLNVLSTGPLRSSCEMVIVSFGPIHRTSYKGNSAKFVLFAPMRRPCRGSKSSPRTSEWHIWYKCQRWSTTKNALKASPG